MPVQSNRRKFLKTAAAGGVALGAGITGFPDILRMRSAHAANEVLIGSLLDQTGSFNISGLPGIAGTQFAIDEINRNGGLLGKAGRAAH